MALSQADFTRLLQLRTGLLVAFFAGASEQAKAAGLTPAKHQLLLTESGTPKPFRAYRRGEIADYLLLRHHSAVGLIDRAATDGLVKRNSDPDNKSVVRITLAPAGTDKLDRLSEAHLEELAHLGSDDASPVADTRQARRPERPQRGPETAPLPLDTAGSVGGSPISHVDCPRR